MREWALLRGEEAGKTPTGQTKYFYSPTPGGLIRIMSNRKELREELDEIARKQAELLPFIFGKWDWLMRPCPGHPPPETPTPVK